MALAGCEPATPPRSYAAVHQALRRVRGSAIGTPCAAPGCDRPATGWALVGRPTHLDTDARGRNCRWSVHLDAYAQTCSRHNSQLDRGGSWTLCPHGHARIAWGVNASGWCKGCSREDNRRRRAARRAARAATQVRSPEPAEAPREAAR